MKRIIILSSIYLGLFSVFTTLFSLSVNNIRDNYENLFEVITKDKKQVVQQKLLDKITLTRTFAKQFENNYITREDFIENSLPFIENNPEVSTMTILQRITNETERTRIEQEANEFYNGSFPIKEFYEGGTRISPIKDFYYPITHINPVNKGTSGAINLDIYSNDFRKKSIIETINTKKPAISNILQLVSGIKAVLIMMVTNQLDICNIAFKIIPIIKNSDIINNKISTLLCVEETCVGVDFLNNEIVAQPSNFLFKSSFDISVENKNITLYFFSDKSFFPYPYTFLIFYIIFSLCFLFIFIFLYFQLKKYDDELLKKSKQELNKRNEYHNHLISYICHELRNPLHSLIYFISTLSGEYRSTAESSAKCMLDILNSFLDNTRSISEMKLVNKHHNLRLIVNDIVYQYSKLLSVNFESDVYIASDFINIPKDTVVEIDNTRLRQILNNSISNSCKNTKRGHILVISEIKEERLIIKVLDTGNGIDETKDYFKIYETKENEQVIFSSSSIGKGIGLWVCKNIVDLMKGSVSLKNRSEIKGCVFTLDIPIKIIKKEENIIITIQEEPKSENIIVDFIDDDPTNRFIMEQQIKNISNVEIRHIFNDGSDYINLFNSKNFTIPDLLITDIVMPIMSGDDLCREIRETYTKDQFKIIAVTGNISMTDKNSFSERGFNDFLGKPYTLDELKNIIYKINLL